MSYRLQDRFWEVDLSATVQIVAQRLAWHANDDDARCWPGINGPNGLAAKTGLSERAVQNAIKALVAGGHITREEKVGRGVVYTIHPRTTCTPNEVQDHQLAQSGNLNIQTPAPDAPRTTCTPAPDAPTPAPRAPKQSRTGNTPTDANASSGERERKARRCTLPNGWEPKPLTGRSAEIVARWEPGMLERVIDNFRNHHAAAGKLMIDWDAAWRTWIGNEDEFQNRDRRNGKRAYQVIDGGGGQQQAGSLVGALGERRARRHAVG